MGLADANDTVRESYEFWKAAGLPYVSRVAFLGNEEGECSFLPAAKGDNLSAYSILQWHWEPRGRRIFEATGIDVRTCSHADALKAALWELQHVDTTSWHLLMTAKTIEDAVEVLVRRVENSKMQERDILRRTNYAKKWAGIFIEDDLQ